MKKCLILIFCFFISFAFSFKTAKASDEKINIDDSINSILDGINEENLSDLNDTLDGLFRDGKTLKERILSFISGGENFDFNDLFIYFTGGVSGVLHTVLEIMCYVIFIGILCTTLNKIISKNSDKNENNIIYFICYAIVVVLSSKLVSSVFNMAINAIDKMNKTIDLTFPLLITLAEFSGGFGNVIFKPLYSVLSFLTSSFCESFLIPLLSCAGVCVVIGNISSTVKLNSLKKSILSLVKWSIGIITLLFSIFITAKGAVNSQYNGLSFKVLKYATGSLIPIVGGFISGGIDVLLASSVLVKNSFGLILVVYVFLTVGSVGISILLASFLIKFTVSVCEPLIDNKFIEFSNGIGDVFSCLSAVIFLCGFAYILVCFSVIGSTALII